jgi:membrane associated rhomboid family serine protease
MVQAPVGHHCPDCVREGNKGIRKVRVGSSDALVTKALVAANVLVYLLQQSNPTVTGKYAMSPQQVANGEYYRMFTAAFLHASVMHILFNMLALWIVGPSLEATLGRARYLALYVLSALGGSVCSYFLGPTNVLGVGASGAVFGLFGAYFIVARSRRVDSRQVFGLIVINLIFGFVTPGIDNWAHIGGLVAGGAVAFVFMLTEDLERVVKIGAEVIAVVIVTGAIVMLTQVRTSQLTALAPAIMRSVL